MDNQKRRLTIGVLVSGITDEFTKLIDGKADGCKYCGASRKIY